MDPDQTTPAEPVPTVPENPEPPVVTETPPPEPVVIPETPQVSPTPSEPEPIVETPVSTPSAEPQPPLPPITPVNIPIPNFLFPFNGDFPVTFPFNAQPTTDQMKAKFAQWGIAGHHGIDFGLPEGTEVLVVDSGKVIQSGDNGDYGNSVTIQHTWGKSLYAHLKETKVTVDQDVNAGDVLGLSGQTGAAFGAHLHFGIKPNNSNGGNGYLGFIDPTQYLPPVPQIAPIPPTPPIPPEPVQPAPQSVPVEPKPAAETSPIPEPKINIEPVGVPSQPSQPTLPPEPVVDDAEIQKRAEELLKEKQETFRVLGNQAKTKEKEDNLTKIMQFAQEKKEIDNQQVRDLLHVSQSTATNYLTELVNKGQLRIDKKAKATTYIY